MSPEKTAKAMAGAVAQFMQERDAFARLLGIELLEIRPGFSRAGMRLGPNLLNGLGMPHGGAIFTLADFTFAAAGNSHGQIAVALSMDVHFIRSPKPDAYLTAEAVEIHKGRRTALYRITVAEEAGGMAAELHGMAYRKEEAVLENG